MKYSISFLFSLCLVTSLSAQDPSFLIEQQRTGPGDSVRICLNTNNFQDIISLQFTLTWDAEVLSFLGSSNYGLPGISEFNFNDVRAAEGILPFVWFDGAGEGISLPDISGIFCLYFQALGSVGDSSLIGLSNDPTPIQIGKIDGDQVNEVPLVLLEGKVDIVENPLSLLVTTSNNNCFGESQGSIQLEVINGIPPYRYQWTGPDDFMATTSDLTNLSSGSYALTVRDSIGRGTDTTIVLSETGTALSANAVNTSSSTCNLADGRISVQAQGGTAPYQFDLNGQVNNSGSFSNLAAGDYLMIVTDSNQCQTELMFSIANETGGPPLDLGEDQVLCPGDSLSINAPGGFISYQWTLDGVPLATNSSTVNVNTAGTYRVTAQTNTGCEVNDDLNVSFSNIEGLASGDNTIERGDSTQLNAGDGSDYQWTPNFGLACTTCPSPMAAPESDVTYQVSYLSTDGCLVSDSVLIRVNIPEDELRFEPVTFISPNGDGQNDELFFPGLETYSANEIKIFNRWGQLVFSQIDYQIKGELWDGTLRGQPLPTGVYYYILRVDEQNLSVKKNLTIVR
ncbi:MAG: gliding motility-associated C-terminal domain-containing protein [Bacteroidota bacterium]